jgi:hypothetical protein
MKVTFEIPDDDVIEAGMDSSENKVEFLASLKLEIAQGIEQELGFPVELESITFEGIPEWE